LRPWTVTDDNFPIDFTYKSRPVLLKDNQADLPQLCPPVVELQRHLFNRKYFTTF
jgi:hypothetical protein